MPTDYAIKNGRTVFDATTYTGTAANRSVTNAGSFKPDFVWVKSRSNAYNHYLVDSVRGTTKFLVTNNADAEGTYSAGLTSFDSNGFSLGTDNGSVNGSGATFVGWQWQAGQGTTSSNTSGSITSTVSVNTAAGFSIATWTGNGSLATIGHGLGVAPSLIIQKIRSGTGGWPVYHASMGATGALQLESTSGFSTTSAYWNNTSPTSSVFTVNSGINANATTYVAYCWAEVAGFSKFGSYTGNGSTDGAFVYLGFRPKFVMVKRTDASTNWWMMDTSRNTSNVMGQELYPNLSNAEAQWTGSDFLSNGIKFRTTDVAYNVNGANYVYMAFAENPFKYANAR